MRVLVARVIGVLNCAFSLIGICMFLYLVKIHWNNWPGNPGPLSWGIFVILSALNLCLVGSLAFYGVSLLKSKEVGLRPARNILIAEIVYFVLNICLFWNNASASHSALTVGFLGIAQGPIMPQIVTGYPIFGLIAIIILLRLGRAGGPVKSRKGPD